MPMFLIVDVKSVQITNQTFWSGYIEGEPLEVLVFGKEQLYYISPWYNVEEIAVCPS